MTLQEMSHTYHSQHAALRQRIREKKIAMGHKPDDHEDQEIYMS